VFLKVLKINRLHICSRLILKLGIDIAKWHLTLSALNNQKRKNMLNKLKMTALAAAFAGACVSVQANTIQIGTGLSANGALLGTGAADPNYAVTIGLSLPPTTPTSGVVYDATMYPLVSGPWVPNQPNGQWITPVDPSSGVPLLENGLYTDYSRVLDVTGSSGDLSGEFSTDNPGALYVNGVLVAQTAGWPSLNDTQDYTRFVDFNATLVAGDNTIAFVVYNVPLALPLGSSSSGNPTGLIVDGTATGVQTVA